MNIGSIDLGDRPVLLAPMEDVTDASFRGICKEQGADMVYTEFIPAEGLVRDARKAYAKLLTNDEEAPVGIQIYGSDPDAMVEAAAGCTIPALFAEKGEAFFRDRESKEHEWSVDRLRETSGEEKDKREGKL